MDNMNELYYYAEKFVTNNISKSDNLVNEYARKSYKNILELSKDIMVLSNNDYFSKGSKIILKTLIETAVDLENLKEKQDYYVKVMQLNSIKEEITFIRYYNEDFNDLIQDNNKYGSEKIDKLNEEKQSILKDTDIDFSEVTKVVYKFKLLSDRNRHKKYRIMYDILAFTCHNNIHSFKKKGIKKIKYIEVDEYLDIIASILKNGLINLAHIYGVENVLDKKKLRGLKSRSNNYDEKLNLSYIDIISSSEF